VLEVNELNNIDGLGINSQYVTKKGGSISVKCLGQLDVLEIIRPLQKIMGFPHNLRALFGVLPRFHELVKFGLSGAPSIFGDSEWSRIVQCIDFLIENKKQIQLLFPESTVIRVYGIYAENPLYALFDDIPCAGEIARQYKSLLLTVLPLMQPLESDFRNGRKVYGLRHADICKEIRRLASPDPKIKKIMDDIPVVVMSPKDFYHNIWKAIDKCNASIYYDDETRPIAVILDLFEENVRTKKRKNVCKPESLDFDIVVPDVFVKPEKAAWTGFRSTSSKVFVNHCHFQENVNLRYSKYYEIDADDASDSAELVDPASVFDAPSVCTMELSEEKIAVYFIENRRERARLNARYAIQAIEKENQNLAIKNSTLSGFEWNLILNCLQDISNPVWTTIPDAFRCKTAAWAGCRSLLARQPRYVQKLCIEFVSEVGGQEPPEFVWKLQSNRIILSCQSPLHSAPPPSTKMVKVMDRFETEIPQFLQNMLLRTQVRVGEVFDQNYEKYYTSLLRSINKRHGVEITVLRLENTISDRMAQLSPSDYVTPTYFKGMAPNQLTSSIYTAPDTERLQSVYREACKSLGKYAEFDLEFASSGEQLPIFPPASVSVGSMYVTEFSHVERTIADFQERLAVASRQPGISPVFAHNLYTTYIIIFFLSVCGVRPNSNLLPFDFDIDFKTGLCFVSEKDSNGYTFSRMVWLPMELLEQMQLYTEHCFLLRRFVGAFSSDVAFRFDAALNAGLLSPRSAVDRANDLKIAKSGNPFLFFLSEDGQGIQEVSPKYMQQFMPSDWEERIYALRHFVRTHLFNQKCSGEIIDALYGHADFGQAPWTHLSTLNPVMWRQALGHFLTPLLRALKLQALPSPLISAYSGKNEK
jgi:hypothetical protein